jgi:hypothetical protein
MLTYQNAKENGYTIEVLVSGFIGLYNAETRSVIFEDQSVEYIGATNTRSFKTFREAYLQLQADMEPVNTFLELAEENAQLAVLNFYGKTKSNQSTMVTDVEDNIVEIYCNYENINYTFIYKLDTKEWFLQKIWGEFYIGPHHISEFSNSEEINGKHALKITEKEAFHEARNLYYPN